MALETWESGSSKFFLGTDSAPHAVARKESSCGCAGCFTAHAAMALYAEAFDSVGALQQLEGFASHHGPDFYGLSRNKGRLKLIEETVDVPRQLAFGQQWLQPFRAGDVGHWRSHRV